MPDIRPKRLLLFAYFYPPLGGPAVQRPCKTVKYLAELGWETDVITPNGIVYHSTDDSLASECRHRKVFRTASLDPMFLLGRLKKLLNLDTDKLYFGTPSRHKNLIKKLFPIDDKMGWLPFALEAGKQALLTNRYDAVMVTCGPFSSALAARRIARLGKIPFILDYRDHWTLNNTTDQPRGVAYAILQRLESNLLRSAALVLTATSFMKDGLVKSFGEGLAPKVMPFFNGCDEADFKDKQRQRAPDGTIRISYLGTLYGDRPLTYFLEALSRLNSDHPEQDFELSLIGNFYPETRAETSASAIADKITYIPQQSHSDAIQMMLDSDILLLVIGGAENKWILTGKLFEYLRSQRPILALTDKGSEAALLLAECGHDSVCEIDDVSSIQTQLTRLFNLVSSGNPEYKIPHEYERSRQVRNLAERLDGIIGRKN